MSVVFRIAWYAIREREKKKHLYSLNEACMWEREGISNEAQCMVPPYEGTAMLASPVSSREATPTIKTES